MKGLKGLYHFLGGIVFAIILIACAALFVIAGTIIESYYDSHLYAAQWTYHNPLFGLLLGLFFVNILFSALRRWPFRSRHIPFLITHLGLLMIIGGTLIKNGYGTQGQMIVLEGSGSHHILLPHTLALHIEKKCPEGIATNDCILSTPDKSSFPELEWKVKGYAPHSSEKLETWIKGQQAHFASMAPFPIQIWEKGKRINFPLQTRFQLSGELWQLAALQTEQVEEALQEAYLQDLKIIINSHEHSVEDLLNQPFSFEEGTLKANIHLDFMQPVIHLEWTKLDLQKEIIQIPLKGPKALIPVLISPSWGRRPSLDVDLKRFPTILILADERNDCWICAMDAYGRLSIQSFRESDLQTLIVYDHGFGGYAAQYPFPFSVPTLNRQQTEEVQLNLLQKQLQTAAIANLTLSPPLQALKNACEKANQEWTDMFLFFLYEWGRYHPLLYPKNQPLKAEWKEVFKKFDWKQVHHADCQACIWTSLLFEHLETPLKNHEDIIDFLKRNKWPLTKDLKGKQEGPELLAILAHQMFSLSPNLPSIDKPKHLAENETAHLFSAYLKGYGMDYSLLNMMQVPQESPKPIVLEVSLSHRHRTESPLSKIEDNRPRLLLEVRKGDEKQDISLVYDAFGTGLKWPLLKGEYTIRFQPLLKTIPYHVRLRAARQINYAHSNQPFSYESEVLITDQSGHEIEKILSMNRVHETWDGYRFYLAGMNPSSESGINRVQIVINYDPAKYILTYPGATLVALGIILLFWLWPYKKIKT